MTARRKAAAPLHRGYTAPGFSIEALGRQLAQVWLQDSLLSEVRPRTRAVDAASTANTRQGMALEDLVLVSRAETIPDAIVQLMVATTEALRLSEAEGAEVAERLAKLDNALCSAVRVLARKSSTRLAEIGGQAFLPNHSDPWPDVDTSGIADDRTPAMDGSRVGDTPCPVVHLDLPGRA